MRKLNTPDLFNALRLANSLGLKDLVQNFYEQTKKMTADNQDEVGMEILAMLLEAVAKDKTVENNLYTFLAGPLEMTPNDVMKMSPNELIDSIKAIIDNEDEESWKSFLNSLASLMHLKFKR